MDSRMKELYWIYWCLHHIWIDFKKRYWQDVFIMEQIVLSATVYTTVASLDQQFFAMYFEVLISNVYYAFHVLNDL